jgi:hypothetical protein
MQGHMCYAKWLISSEPVAMNNRGRLYFYLVLAWAVVLGVIEATRSVWALVSRIVAPS